MASCNFLTFLASFPGEGNGNPLQCSCLENSMDGWTWQATKMGLQRVRHDWAINTSFLPDVAQTQSFPQPFLSASFPLSPNHEAVSLTLVISFDSDHILTFMIIIHRSLSQRQGPCLSSLAYVRWMELAYLEMNGTWHHLLCRQLVGWLLSVLKLMFLQYRRVSLRKRLLSEGISSQSVLPTSAAPAC